MDLKKANKTLHQRFGGRVQAALEDGAIRVCGQLDSWEDIMEACSLCATPNSTTHVVNDIVFTGHEEERKAMRLPEEQDDSLEGDCPDVMIIGGGISGASIARELTRWKLDILLVDKEADLAMQATGRNDGEVHPGVDLGKGSLKQKYVVRGNRMFDQLCEELDVPFIRYGQYAGFTDKKALPLMRLYAWHRKHVCGVTDTEIVLGDELKRREPGLNPDFQFALYNPSAGSVCPYGLTIAYGENAISNGARISLNTAVTGMTVENGRITAVHTNRGTVRPRLVINAAGVFAEDVAAMAQDRFYSIHPRKGTNSIMDRKVSGMVYGIASITLTKNKAAHTKGGGIIHTVHDNLLIGPDARETWEKENFATEPSSIEKVFAKQKLTAGALNEKDIITYFTGVRPATFEEDFIIEKGRKTENLIHCAGIQSPGLTTAPAVAVDVSKMAVEMLSSMNGAEDQAGGTGSASGAPGSGASSEGGAKCVRGPVEPNPDFNPVRKGVPVLKEMDPEQRNAMIEKNPDYGVIVCRCEEISKGEILDALRSPLPVTTVDGVKKRVRPGMGRCQGGFCMPLVIQIISEFTGLPEEEVRKSGSRTVISYGKTKGGAGAAAERGSEHETM